ncbi:MAG TPA: hypothetical protein VGA33_00895 [Thermoanaerobaculia bacterium]
MFAVAANAIGTEGLHAAILFGLRHDARAHARDQISDIEWFRQQVERRGAHPLPDERGRGGAGDDDFPEARRVVFFERFHEPEAVEVGHHEIEDDDVVVNQTQFEDRLKTVGRFLDPVSLALEDHSDQSPDGDVVLDHEDHVFLGQLSAPQ